MQPSEKNAERNMRRNHCGVENDVYAEREDLEKGVFACVSEKPAEELCCLEEQLWVNKR